MSTSANAISSALTATILSQMKYVTRAPDEYLKFAFKSDDQINVWYILMSNFSGNNNEYLDGEYLLELIMGPNYPYSPPDFRFLTPNGLYDTQQQPCISIGSYHKNKSRPVLNASSFAHQILSGFIGWVEMGAGISLLNDSLETKRRYARESRAYNRRHNAEALDIVERSFAQYSKRWRLDNIPDYLQQKLKLGKYADTNTDTNTDTNEK